MLTEELIELAKKVCKQKSEEQTIEVKAPTLIVPKDCMIRYPAFPIRIMVAFSYSVLMKEQIFKSLVSMTHRTFKRK